jgi:hypothetical protein
MERRKGTHQVASATSSKQHKSQIMQLWQSQARPALGAYAPKFRDVNLVSSFFARQYGRCGAVGTNAAASRARCKSNFQIELKERLFDDEGAFAKGQHGGEGRRLPKGWLSKGYNRVCKGRSCTSNGSSVATTITTWGVVISADLAHSSALPASALLQQEERIGSHSIRNKVPSNIASAAA